MAVFPPAAPVTVIIDGRTVWSYNGAYERNGRVFAPLRPFVTTVADRIWFEDGGLVIVRDGRSVKVRMPGLAPDALDTAYVPLAGILRSLGESVEYGERRTVVVRSPSVPLVATPTPFDASLPSAPPRSIFTPIPEPTPRPVWTGSPLPRRTPLPFPTARP